jgi:hypothetical protein
VPLQLGLKDTLTTDEEVVTVDQGVHRAACRRVYRL